jgi:hypothetical protein
LWLGPGSNGARGPAPAHACRRATVQIRRTISGERPITQVLRQRSLRLGHLLDVFSEHNAFIDRTDLAQSFLHTFGGERIVHGHTPITKVTGQPPEEVTDPYVYADGLCVNVDQCLYRGGPGFVYRSG